MDLGLSNKVAVITGGSAGIGKATALNLLKEGAKVAICGRRAKLLENTKNEFNINNNVASIKWIAPNGKYLSRMFEYFVHIISVNVSFSRIYSNKNVGSVFRTGDGIGCEKIYYQ